MEDAGHVGVLEVEVQSGRFADEGKLGVGHGHGGGDVTAEELRFESVEVSFEIDEFAGAGAAGHLAHELIDRSAAGGLDVASGPEGGDGPLSSFAEQYLVYKIAADVPVVHCEVGLQACVVGG